jgi:hypothetical protein
LPTITPKRRARPELKGAERYKPLRSRTASRPKAREDSTISEEVSEAVKRGYDIITENIRQGREAAERFRDGEYSLRETPDEIARLTTRMMLLAREMSTATFDVVDRLARELGSAISAAKDRDGSVPPFRSAEAGAAPKPPDPSRLRVTPRCEGNARAFGRPTMVDRPKGQIRPRDLQAGPLTSRSGISRVVRTRFEVDLSREGVVAVLKPPANLTPGVYSAMIYAGEDPSPLGSITIEILK